MDKFTQKIGKFEVRKYTDRVKNDIYTLIKENIDVKIDGNKGFIDGNVDISLDGIEELTDVLYNYVQQEKSKQEILTLEQIKLNASIRTINIKNINEYIDNVKNQSCFIKAKNM